MASDGEPNRLSKQAQITDATFARSVSNTAMDQLRQDLVSAIRNVRKYPVACIVAIVSLAGGLGATTATLTVRNVLFRNPPPLYPDPGRLSRVQVGTPQQPIQPLGSAVPAAVFR